MHYKNGREAKVGDKVISKDGNGNPVSGIVVAANAQSATCNLVIQPLRLGDQIWATAKDCLHVDDSGL